MKNSFFKILGILLVPVLCISAKEPEKTIKEKYIEKYSAIAVQEMYRTGIPASITLAQGLLESGAGQSPLAVEGNNHFGIKCHTDWTGKRMYHDDDKLGECFRVYKSPEMSFRDHSDFLRYRDRYKELFELQAGDYKAWAYGLKKTGYATDPAYPSKLIKIIEDYKLHEYDKAKSGNYIVEDGKIYLSYSEKKQRRVRTERQTKKTADKKKEELLLNLPQSPLSIEEPKPLERGMFEIFNFPLSRQHYSKNGVPFIYSAENESYEGIAETYNLFLKELLSFNDLKEDIELPAGTIVYLQRKKNHTPRSLDKYIAEGGESLWSISQRFAIKMKYLIKMNNIPEDYVAREGDTIILRKDKKVERIKRKARQE